MVGKTIRSFLVNICIGACVGAVSTFAWADTSTLSIGDASATVTGPGTTLQFPITRSGDLGYDTYASYQTVDGSAKAGTDYTAASGIIKVPAGATHAAVPVSILGSSANPPDKSFTLALTGAAGAGPTANFSTHADFATGAFPASLAAVDMNGDGLPDLVNESGNSISVLLNITAPGAVIPSFASQQTFANELASTVQVADLNSDGRADLIVLSNDGTGIYVLLNTTIPGDTTLSFSSPQSIVTGSAALSVGVADLNGDDEPDLIVTTFNANFIGGSVAVMYNITAPGASTASFEAQQVFDTESEYFAVGMADLNNDGRSDLTVEIYTSTPGTGAISVMFNTAVPGTTTPVFSERQTYAVGNIPTGGNVADVNGDGKPDLIIANQTYDGSGNFVSVMINTAAAGATTPAFAAPQAFSTGPFPLSVATADLNGDGKPDLVVANGNAANVSVLLNITAPGATTPAFVAQQTFATQGTPLGLAVKDVNGDGKADILATNIFDNSISVLLNTTPSSAALLAFSPQTQITPVTVNALLTFADMNSDGRPDLLTTDGSNQTVNIMLNTTTLGASTPSFAPAQMFQGAGGGADVLTADVNGDGKPDVITVNESTDSISVLLNATPPGSSTLSFAPTATFADGIGLVHLAMADINDDGRPDIIATEVSSFDVAVLLNTTTTGATTPSFAGPVFFQPDAIYSVFSSAVADLNGDGKPDLIVVSNLGNEVVVLLNTTAPGASMPSFGTPVPFAVVGPFYVAVSDLNGDGRPDIVVTGGGDAATVLLNITPPNASTPSFSAPTMFPDNGVGLSFGAALKDMDGDGRPDIVMADGGPGTVSVMLNTTAAGAATPSFASPVILKAGFLTYGIAVPDLNGDGRPDIVATNIGTGFNSISVMLNTQYVVSASPASVTGTIHFDVPPPPAASAGGVSTQVDHAVDGALSGSTDVSTFVVTTPPIHGQVTITDAALGHFTYTPSPGYVGTDQFEFDVSDSFRTSQPATETVTVDDIAPVAGNASVSTPMNTFMSGVLLAAKGYPEQHLSYQVSAAPRHGSVAVNITSGSYRYTPHEGYFGPDDFSFIVSDGHSASNAGVISVCVTRPRSSTRRCH